VAGMRCRHSANSEACPSRRSGRRCCRVRGSVMAVSATAIRPGEDGT
jgi:hypothetical protein